MRSRVVRAKKRAKVLLFFDMTKKNRTFFKKKCILIVFGIKMRNFRATFFQKSAFLLLKTISWIEE